MDWACDQFKRQRRFLTKNEADVGLFEPIIHPDHDIAQTAGVYSVDFDAHALHRADQVPHFNSGWIAPRLEPLREETYCRHHLLADPCGISLEIRMTGPQGSKKSLILREPSQRFNRWGQVDVIIPFDALF